MSTFYILKTITKEIKPNCVLENSLIYSPIIPSSVRFLDSTIYACNATVDLKYEQAFKKFIQAGKKEVENYVESEESIITRVSFVVVVLFFVIKLKETL